MLSLKGKFSCSLFFVLSGNLVILEQNRETLGTSEVQAWDSTPSKNTHSNNKLLLFLK